MARILHIKASPRMDSYSYRLSKAFLEAFRRSHPQVGIETLDLFGTDLPPFEAPAAAAKYQVLSGQEPQGRDAEVWQRVIEVINHFKSADMYVLSSPMWNFSIPYRLKQYLDILVQPGLTFTWSPQEGYKGLLGGRPAVLCLARGGDYPSDTQSASLDMQKPYLELILGFIGITDIRSIIVEPTFQGAAVAEEKLQAAIAEARKMAEDWKL